MEDVIRLETAEIAAAEGNMDARRRCEHALDLLLTHRGNPSAEIAQVLADDADNVFGHCLRAALIVCVGGRWRVLADRWKMQDLADARPFYIVHAMMAFSAAGYRAAAARIFKALRQSETIGASSLLPEEALASPFCEALVAFVRSNFSECVDWLTRVRRLAHRCGGSLAQCDLIHLTYTEAALRARKVGLARALVAERAARRPARQFNRLLQQRLHAAIG